MYMIGALRNAELAQKLYPDWTCRYYIFSECHFFEKELLKYPNVETILVNKKGSHYSMMYRFLPLGENDVDYFISRDTDSRLSIREKVAVDEWIKSGKSFHIMKDHPLHYTPEFPILGGMWGAKGRIIPDIKDKINNFFNFNEDKHGMDQKLLFDIYHQYAINDNLEHTEETFTLKRDIERDKIWFIGQPIDENENFHGNWKLFLDKLGINNQ